MKIQDHRPHGQRGDGCGEHDAVYAACRRDQDLSCWTRCGFEELFTDGKGRARRSDTNDTDMGRARNRRIEFSVVQ